MEELKKRYDQLIAAYKRLDYMTRTFVALSENCKQYDCAEENELVTHRDALIKRFEFCYDLTWKFFKLLLKKKYLIDVASPRAVFQESYQQGIVSRDDVERFLDMIGIRNETSHTYDEERANVVSKKIVQHAGFLEQVLLRDNIKQ